MLTVATVAELLGVTPGHVLDLIHAKRLPALNVGCGRVKPRWRIRVADLEAFTSAVPVVAPVKRTRRKKSTDVIAFY